MARVGVRGVAAHQVQVRLGAVPRRARRVNGLVIRAAAESAIPTGVSVGFILAACRLSAGWETVAAAVCAAVLTNAMIAGRSSARSRSALRRIADMANRAAGGDLEAKAPETSAGEIGQVAREVNHLVAATQAERVDLEARLRVLDDEARSLRAAARQREAELEAQLRLASRYLREPVLSVHACANLLARDCAGRMDAQGRERLDQLRTSAEALDMRLGELLEGCRSKRTQNDSTTCRGVVASGDQGDAVRGK